MKRAIGEIVEDDAIKVHEEIQQIDRRSNASTCKKARTEMSRGVRI
jgi:hypothetical protein